jgi:hypothetical protein
MKLKIIIKSIVKFFDKKSIKSKEPYENIEYKSSFKKNLEEYNKSFFLFDDNFDQFLD